MGIKVLSLDFHGTLVEVYPLLAFYYIVIPWVVSKEKEINFSEAAKIVTTEYANIGPMDYRWHDPFFWIKKFNISIPFEKLIEKTFKISRVELTDPNIPNILEKVKRRGIKIIIVTTPPKLFIDVKMSELKGIGNFIDDIYSTVDMFKLPKVPEVYTKISQILNVEPKEILHVGDSLKDDYISPKKAGWNAVLYDRENFHKDIEERIMKFEEILNFLS